MNDDGKTSAERWPRTGFSRDNRPSNESHCGIPTKECITFDGRSRGELLFPRCLRVNSNIAFGTQFLGENFISFDSDIGALPIDRFFFTGKRTLEPPQPQPARSEKQTADICGLGRADGR